MRRIAKRLEYIEDQIVFLASNEHLPAEVRECLIPVMESHMETVNRFKVFQVKMTGNQT